MRDFEDELPPERRVTVRAAVAVQANVERPLPCPTTGDVAPAGPTLIEQLLARAVDLLERMAAGDRTEPADLLDTADAAALYAVSRRLWQQWNAAGRVPAPVKVGKIVRWRRAELHAHIAAGMPPRSAWAVRKWSAAKAKELGQVRRGDAAAA